MNHAPPNMKWAAVATRTASQCTSEISLNMVLLLEGPNRSDLDIQRGCGHRDGSSDACLSHGLGGGLLVAAHDAGDDALELHGPGAAAVLALIRFDKLVRLIEQCRYGIHDLSRTTPDSVNRLPRFNMPL